MALACVAACGGGQGVDLEIRGDNVALDSVEIYIAYDKCHNADDSECEGVAWPQAQDRVPGTVYVLKGDEKVVRTDDLVDGAATIHLEAAAGYEYTKAIAIVGYQGGRAVGVKLIHGAIIPLHDEEKWMVRLDEVGPATTDVTTPPAETAPQRRIHTWLREQSPTLPDPTGYAGCLAYQRWSGTEWEISYFVPESDTDCDGAPPDCDPLWAHAPLGAAKCVTHPTATTLANACVLGTETCSDEMSTQACTPVSTPLICMPDVVCANCAASDSLLTCIKEQVSSTSGSTPSVPVMNCAFIPDPNAVTTPNGPCEQTQVGGERMTFSVPGVCSSTNPANLALLRPMAAPFSGGSATITVGGTATMTVHATPGTNNCNISIDWTGGEGKTPQVVLLALQYGARQVLIPVSIGFKTATCPISPLPCEPSGNWPEGNIAAGDPMFACTQGP
jgi:hypothetical protein